VTDGERVSAVADLGFTERQAGFLVQVMLHSGVCLGRQYCAYARIVRGQKMVDFFRKLVTKRFATPYACAHNKAQVYHVHHVTLYAAIGEPHARFRKRSALARAVERLMILDHLIAHRTFTWLGAEKDKVAHFLTVTPLRRGELPRLAFGDGTAITVRYFPDKLPIGVSVDMRVHVFAYLLTNPWPQDFRAFLRRHAALLRGLPRWSLHLLVPVPLTKFMEPYCRAFHEELGTPLHPQIVDELRWFYSHRQAASHPEPMRLQRARRAFRAPRFRALERAWRLDGDRVFDLAVSTSLADAIARGDGRLECYELSRQYLHLAPLVGTA
jgi:hypothetical protein